MRTAPAPADADVLLALLRDAADAVASALATASHGGLAGSRPGQYHADIVADAAAVAVLARSGVGVLSEESGRRAGRPDGPDVVVVVDPLDGSTNADRGVPWFATSLCAVDRFGPAAAVVVDLTHEVRFEAVRGQGARRDGLPMAPSPCTTIGDAVIGLSGWPPSHLGWAQYRALGAVALDLCAVASGVLDGYVDCSYDAHGPWDYLGGALVCREAGAVVSDAHGRDLVVLDHLARRTPVAAATPALHGALATARSTFR